MTTRRTRALFGVLAGACALAVVAALAVLRGALQPLPSPPAPPPTAGGSRLIRTAPP